MTSRGSIRINKTNIFHLSLDCQKHGGVAETLPKSYAMFYIAYHGNLLIVEKRLMTKQLPIQILKCKV